MSMALLEVDAIQSDFNRCGTQLFAIEETPLTQDEIQILRAAALAIPREHVGVGDTGEECELEVGRVMVDVTEPIVVNPIQSDVILPIVSSKRMADWVARKTGHAGHVYVRRCAINYMPEGSIVGAHNDGETNPDYLYFVVLHLNEDFKGGEFYSTDPTTGKFVEFSNNAKLCLSRCNVLHGVKRVTEGLRASLIWFYADENAPRMNRRNYAANPLPEDSAAARGFSGLIEPGRK